MPVFAADIKGDLSGIAEPWARPRRPSSSARRQLGLRLRAGRVSGGVLGSVRRAGPSDPRHRLGDGAAAAVAPARPQRRAGGRAQHRLPRRRRAGPAAARPQGSARDARLRRRARRRTDRRTYGNVSKQTIGTIQRQLLVLENQGGDKFFGEPALALKDFMRTDRDGRGYINILAADKLMENPRLYATFLLWLLSELFEELPEVGDPDKPKLVLLLRRGASAVQRRAEGAARQDRAGGAADPLEGRRRLFRHAESARRAGQGAGAARQPRAARAARLHAARPEGGEGRGRHLPRQSQARHRHGDHGTRQGRGAGVVPGRQRHAVDGRALHDPAAVGADRADHAGRAQGRHGQEPGQGQIRSDGRSRIRPTRSCRSASRRPARPRRRSPERRPARSRKHRRAAASWRRSATSSATSSAPTVRAASGCPPAR